MSDFADLAAAREQEMRDDALAEHSRRMERACVPTDDWPGLDRSEHDGHKGKRHVTASAERCAVCDEPIPEARRQAVYGVQTCIDCQRELEAAMSPADRRRAIRRAPIDVPQPTRMAPPKPGKTT
jgi:phage/conjugal plasmid C-4 type zinc finger TraR family protein